jgi:hypothetical protein
VSEKLLPNDGPEHTQLWEKSHRARKARLCDCCKEMIEVGQRYRSSGYLLDGKFEYWVRHEFGEMCPSGCPKFRARDLAEAEEQFRKDEALFGGPQQ